MHFPKIGRRPTPAHPVRAGLLAAALLPALASCDATPPADYLFQDVHVVDVAAGRVDRDRDLYVRDGRIVRIEPTSTNPGPARERVDLHGTYALPGLYDMHTHVDTESRLALMLPDRPGIRVTREDVLDDVAPYLLYGVTTIAVLEGSEELMAIARGGDEGRPIPRLFLTSPILDGPEADNPNHVTVGSVDEVDSVFAMIDRVGYPAVKVYSSLAEDVYLKILEEAHERGLLVFGHLPPAIDRSVSLDPRLSNVAHAEELLRIRDETDTSFISSSVEMLASRGISLTPNLVVYHEIIEQLRDLEAHWAAMDTAVVPPQARLYSARDENGYVESFGGPDIRDRAIAYFQRGLAFMEELTAAAQDGGVLLLAGTDVGNPTMFPGQSLVQELQLLVEAGLTPFEALRAATVNAATLLGEADHRGNVAVGMTAELVFTADDPSADPSALRGVRGLLHDGRLFRAADLDSLRAGLTERYAARARAYAEVGRKGRR